MGNERWVQEYQLIPKARGMNNLTAFDTGTISINIDVFTVEMDVRLQIQTDKKSRSILQNLGEKVPSCQTRRKKTLVGGWEIIARGSAAPDVCYNICWLVQFWRISPQR